MNSTYYVLHIFRMTVFFLIAGFFARMLLYRRGVPGFVLNRAKRIFLPLVIFWPVVMFSTVVAIILAASLAHEKTPSATAMTPRTFPLTHLWFLYWLLMLYVGTLGLRGLVRMVDRTGVAQARFVDPLVRRVVTSGMTPVVLGAPLCVAFFSTRGWLMWYGVPAAENGLIPTVAGLVAYWTAFGFGWHLQRQPELFRVWQRHCFRNLAFAVALTGVCLWRVGVIPAQTPGPQDWNRLGYAIAYTLAIWTWTTGLIGLALRFLSGGNPRIRYVADASYWIYIVHLPLVMFLQAGMSRLPVSWLVKYVLILAIAYPVLLLSYHYLVRTTFIGALLNGRRYRKPALP
jgi:peptidoglycan/LPS O-acetylase OafA/YrhL